MRENLLGDLKCRLDTQRKRCDRPEGPDIYDHPIKFIWMRLTRKRREGAIGCHDLHCFDSSRQIAISDPGAVCRRRHSTGN